VKSKKHQKPSSFDSEDDLLPHSPNEDIPSPLLTSLPLYIGESSHSQDDAMVHGIAYLKAKVNSLQDEMKEMRSRQDDAAIQMNHMTQLLEAILSRMPPPDSSSQPLPPQLP